MMAVFIKRLFKLSIPLILVLGITVEAQSPTKYGVGRPPTDAEITAWDISISPTGEELPVGSGTADLGAQLFLEKGCAGCHGTNGTDGIAPRLVKRDVGVLDNPWDYGRILPIRSPFATTELRILLLDVIDATFVVWPSVKLALYVDDLTMQFSGRFYSAATKVGSGTAKTRPKALSRTLCVPQTN